MDNSSEVDKILARFWNEAYSAGMSRAENAWQEKIEFTKRALNQSLRDLILNHKDFPNEIKCDHT